MPPFVKSLHQLLPPGRVLDRPADRAAYEADSQTAFRCRGAAVVLPHTTEELISVAQWCHRTSVPFVVRGSGTGLSAGATPVSDGIVIVTTRLNRILHLDPTQRIAVVEPGVINADVSRAAAAHGLFFAPDPSSQPVCSIGGNIGFNAGGAHCFKYGMTSNHVLGVKAVLGSGEVVSWGGATRDHIGPDATGLFVGNEGLFGIVVEATLNLLPIPDGCHTVLAGFDSATAAGDAVSAIIASGLIPVAMELMDELTIRAVRPVVPIAYPPRCRALLLVELEGPAALVAAERPRLEQLLRANGATGLISAHDAHERANIWRVRKSAHSAYGRLAPNNFVQDSVVPRRHFGAAVQRVQDIARRHNLQCPVVCHAGDGNLHPNLLYHDEHPGEFAAAEKAAAEILRMSVELGGSITGEHGVGLEKRAFLPLMYGPDDLELFHGIRHAFDPGGLANPGKMLPDPTPAPPAASPPAPARRPTGITDYAPEEFVISATADTPLTTLIETLATEDQQLLFDPPLPSATTSIGDVLLANLNGPRALGYGRARDAILEARFRDGRPRDYRTGARVVKNVAGFDVPKFLVGSMGIFGTLQEVTLKVAPRPAATVIHHFQMTDRTTFLAQLSRLAGLPTPPAALEADPAEYRIWLCFDGPPDALPGLSAALGDDAGDIVDADLQPSLTRQWRTLAWADPAADICKVPVGLPRLPAWLEGLPDATSLRGHHLSLAGDVAWIAAPAENMPPLRQQWARSGFDSQLVRGTGDLWVTSHPVDEVLHRIKQLLDPHNLLPALPRRYQNGRS